MEDELQEDFGDAIDPTEKDIENGIQKARAEFACSFKIHCRELTETPAFAALVKAFATYDANDFGSCRQVIMDIIASISAGMCPLDPSTTIEAVVREDPHRATMRVVDESIQKISEIIIQQTGTRAIHSWLGALDSVKKQEATIDDLRRRVEFLEANGAKSSSSVARAGQVDSSDIPDGFKIVENSGYSDDRLSSNDRILQWCRRAASSYFSSEQQRRGRNLLADKTWRSSIGLVMANSTLVVDTNCIALSDDPRLRAFDKREQTIFIYLSILNGRTSEDDISAELETDELLDEQSRKLLIGDISLARYAAWVGVIRCINSKACGMSKFDANSTDCWRAVDYTSILVLRKDLKQCTNTDLASFCIRNFLHNTNGVQEESFIVFAKLFAVLWGVEDFKYLEDRLTPLKYFLNRQTTDTVQRHLFPLFACIIKKLQLGVNTIVSVERVGGDIIRLSKNNIDISCKLITKVFESVENNLVSLLQERKRSIDIIPKSIDLKRAHNVHEIKGSDIILNDDTIHRLGLVSGTVLKFEENDVPCIISEGRAYVVGTNNLGHIFPRVEPVVKWVIENSRLTEKLSSQDKLTAIRSICTPTGFCPIEVYGGCRLGSSCIKKHDCKQNSCNVQRLNPVEYCEAIACVLLDYIHSLSVSELTLESPSMSAVNIESPSLSPTKIVEEKKKARLVNFYKICSDCKLSEFIGGRQISENDCPTATSMDKWLIVPKDIKWGNSKKRKDLRVRLKSAISLNTLRDSVPGAVLDFLDITPGSPKDGDDEKLFKFFRIEEKYDPIVLNKELQESAKDSKRRRTDDRHAKGETKWRRTDQKGKGGWQDQQHFANSLGFPHLMNAALYNPIIPHPGNGSGFLQPPNFPPPTVPKGFGNDGKKGGKKDNYR